MADTWLKQSTSVSVVIGPIWATADGALKADLAHDAAGINCDIYKNGTKADVTLANLPGDGYFRAASGEALYLLTLSTGHTDTLGRLEISLSATGYYMKPRSYMVVPANVWDSMFGADYLKTEVVEISGDSTAADNLEADYDGTGYAKTASTTKLHADYDAAKTAASQSSVNTIAGYLDTEVAAILAAVDTEVAAIKAKTDNLPADPADDSDIDAQLATIAGYIDTEVAAILAAVDTEVAAIKAKTDQLNFSGTDVKATLDGETVTVATNNDKTGYALTSAYDAAKTAAAAGAKMDLVDAPNATAITAIQSGLATSSALSTVAGYVDTEVAAIKGVTDKLDTALEADGGVYRLTTNALEQAPTGSGATAQQVWEYATRTLTALDEDATTLDLNSTIAAAVPSASSVASAVRTELSTELSRIDANVSSRSTLTAQQVWEYTTRGLTTFGTLVSDIASAVWSAVSRTLTGNVTVGGYASGQSPADLVDLSDLAQTGEAAAAVATLNNLSSAQVQAAAGAALTSYGAAKVGDIPTPPSTSAIASQVRTELSTELARMDADVSSRLAATSYSTPPSAAAIASQVRSEIATELSRLDASVSSRLATSGYTAPPSASAVAAAVWSAVTRTLTAIDVDVDEAAIAEAIITAIGEQGIEVDTAAIAQAVIAGLGALTVTVTSPVATDGTVTIYQGDDYSAAEARQITFDIADVAHVLGLDDPEAGAKLKLAQATFVATGITSTDEGYTVMFEPTASETAALNMHRQSYELEVTTAAGNTVTIATGTALVTRDIPEITS